MDRRRFLQVTTIAGAAVGLSACGDGGQASIPEDGVDLGPVDDLVSRVRDAGGVLDDPSTGAYVVEVPADQREPLAAVWDPAVGPGLAAGILVLSKRCPHLACHVSHCERSGWFECPCHGSRFSRAGERRKGPATRGMSAYPVEVVDGRARVLATAVKGLDGDVDVTEDPEPSEHCS